MRYYQCDKYPIEFVLSENIDKHFDSHNHARHYVISVVMQGEVVVYLKSSELICHKGDAFIIQPFVVHSVCQGKDARLLSLCIGTDFIEETDLETMDGILQELLKDTVEQGVFGREQKEKLLASMETVYRLRDNGRKEVDAGMKILTEKITSHPEQEQSIEALAADNFISKYYFIRKFKSSIGMTPHQFCIQNRIRKSQSMLDGDKTISRIAAQMGFYDQSHFDKAFRRIVGISPSEYVNSKKRI